MSEADSDSDTVDDVCGGLNDVAKRKNDEDSQSFGNKKVCLDRGTASATKKVVQRKFPGPAGLLTTNDTNSERQSWKDFSFNKSVNQMEILCSQASVAAFNSPIWRRMLQDYSDSGLLEKCNIEWIKRKAAQKRLLDQKAPFLAAVIQSIEPSFTTVTLFLKDSTGEIQGHMPCKLYKEHTNELLVGAVVILKQPAVLTLNFGESHYLILTARNLVQIYYPGKKKTYNSSDVNLIELQSFAVKELLGLISDIEKRENNKETKDCGFKTTENRQTVVINSFRTHPQTVEQQITIEKKKKFDFKVAKGGSQKSGDESLSQCSQIVIKSQNPAHEKILHKVFDGVDADSFFDDF